MLETIIVILLVLWVIGFVTSNTFGGVLHMLLLIAGIALVFRFFTTRRVA